MTDTLVPPPARPAPTLPPVIARLVATTNDHDLDGLVACFAADYRLSMPTHPSGGFVGPDQVRRNWDAIFAGFPDIRVSALNSAVRDVECWVEMEMRGTRRDGLPLHLRGPMIFTTGDDLIHACRFYLAEVDHSPAPFGPPGAGRGPAPAAGATSRGRPAP